MQIKISVADIELSATLNESPTAQAVADALPISGTANVWGDEIYFAIPVSLGEEPNAQAEVAVGDLAYWPPGNAFCIFYGRTPASTGDAPCAASPVNVFGTIEGDATQLCIVRGGASVNIVAADK